MNNQDSLTTYRAVPGATLRAMVGTGQAVEAKLEAALSTLDLTWPQYEVLQALSGQGTPPMLSELADRVRCVRSNMTALVDRLERRGLVRRIPHPEDRRSIRVELTVAGSTAYREAAQVLTRLEAQILATLSAEEQELLCDVFARMTS